MIINESVLQTYRISLAEKLRHYQKLMITVFRCHPVGCGVEYMGSVVNWAFELRMRHESELSEPHFVCMIQVPAGAKDDSYKGDSVVGGVSELESFFKMRCQFLESRCEAVNGVRLISLYWAEKITHDYTFGFQEKLYSDGFCQAKSPSMYEIVSLGKNMESYAPFLELEKDERCFVAEWVLLKNPDSVYSYIQYARMVRDYGGNYWGRMLINEYDKRFAGRDDDLDLLERTFPSPVKEHADFYGRPSPQMNDYVSKLLREFGKQPGI